MPGSFREFKARLVGWTFFRSHLFHFSRQRETLRLVWGVRFGSVWGVCFVGFVVLLAVSLTNMQSFHPYLLILMTCAHRTRGVRTRAKNKNTASCRSPFVDGSKQSKRSPAKHVGESEAESSITGTREPSPIYAQPVPVGGDDFFLHGHGRYVCREAQVTLIEFKENFFSTSADAVWAECPGHH